MKNILKYIIVSITLFFIGFMALILVSFIPKATIRENVAESADFMKKQGEVFEFNSIGRTIFNHNSTDAIMLNIVYSLDDENVIDSVLRARRNYIPNVSTEFVEDKLGNLKHESAYFFMTNELYDLVNGEKQKVFDYARYWHGYIVILRPLLLIFNIFEIRIILQIVLLLFFVILLYYISKKRSWKLSLIYLVSFIALDLLAWITTIQGILVMIIATVTSVFIANGKINNKNMNLLLFISGALTAYFDFLTTPLITFLLPIITYKMINIEETTIKKELISFIKNGFSWGVGYLGFWTSKWIITDLILDTEIIKLSLEQILYRIGSGRKNINFLALLYNCIFSANILNIIMYVTTFCCSLCFVARKGIKYFFEKQKLYYYLCMIIPIVWYCIIADHSYQHYFFTYKTLIITLLGYMLIVFDDRKIKK